MAKLGIAISISSISHQYNDWIYWRAHRDMRDHSVFFSIFNNSLLKILFIIIYLFQNFVENIIYKQNMQYVLIIIPLPSPAPRPSLTLKTGRKIYFLILPLPHF